VARPGLAASDPTRLSVELLIAQKQGDHAEQLRTSEALFKLRPTTQSVLAFAQAQADVGRRDAFEGTLRTWLERHADDDAVTFALAQYYGQAGHPAEAVSLFRSLVARHPDNAIFLNNLAWYLKDSDPKEGLTFAERAYARADNDIPVVDTYALLLVRNGRADAALRALDKGIDTVREPAMLRLRRVDVLAMSGDREKALAELEGLRAQGVPAELRALIDALEKRLGGGR
jgi:tetratricopeptide (TPR) repeat protein